MVHQALLFLHLAGAMVWVGGMFFAYFCLRPAAAQLLQPPERLPLWVATFERFFQLTAVAVVLILLSGLTMLAQAGFSAAPRGWHIMMTLGIIMAGIFGYVYAGLFPKLRGHCAAAAWPAAGAVLNTIRQWVAVNLVLSAGVIAAAVSARG
jgi:uncharacterized membrane protein